MIPLSKLAVMMTEHDRDRRRVNHFLKVCGYCSAIGEAEGMTPEALNMLQAAALLHDVGIKPAMARYGSGAGQYQQTEGPPVAAEMLAELGITGAAAERICFLISRHHTYTDIDGLDHQILIEADFLVNCDEKGFSREKAQEVLERIFKTPTGIHLFKILFALD